MTTFVVISGRVHFFYILYIIEDLGLKCCRGMDGLLDSPKHTNSQRKTLSMRQMPVNKSLINNFVELRLFEQLRPEFLSVSHTSQAF